MSRAVRRKPAASSKGRPLPGPGKETAVRYVVFDTETPNSRNDRMSQIGVCVLEDGQICGEYGALINPECGFDFFNIALTGITPEMTYGEPCFGKLWEDVLRDLFSKGTLVAHNAPFDMAVLGKCLRAYGISWRSRVEYIDTVRVTRRAFPELENHKLSTLSLSLGIELSHHDALSDARACAEVFLRSLGRGIEPLDFTRSYDLGLLRTLSGAAR